jgi:succinate dehydrogenase / fumarate reductase cytochrome b subunit|tara:strand:+ start:78 stop:461 length:384 start_codon:yes stop_codon:yes gene_type:complete
MSTKPVFINLFKINLPLSGFLSITHRISGLLIFFLILPFSAYFLLTALDSPEAFLFFFENLNNNLLIRTFVLFMILIFQYHVFTGVRHMLLDFHIIGETLSSSNISAVITLVLFFINALVSIWLVLL